MGLTNLFVRTGKKISVGLFLFTYFLVILRVEPSYAASLPFLSKTKIRLSVPAGETAYGDIIVDNPSKDTQSLRLYLEDWRYMPSADGVKEFLPAGTTPYSCASWISFAPADFKILPLGKKRISYSVKIPEGVKGTYYAVLFFETLFGNPANQQEGVGAGINLAIRIAALFYVEIKGTVVRKADFDNLVVSKESVADPLNIALDFHNKGNVDITCGGTYHLMDRKGNVLARGEFNDVYTFMQENALLRASWKEPIPKGTYDLVLTLNIGKAQEAGKPGKVPAIVKEATLEIGENGSVVNVGELK